MLFNELDGENVGVGSKMKQVSDCGIICGIAVQLEVFNFALPLASRPTSHEHVVEILQYCSLSVHTLQISQNFTF